jgi:ABC-type transporter Mla subunit MlaD
MRFWLGAFVLLALILLASLVILFGSFPTVFRTTNPYYVRFTDAPGVTPGTPVRRSGVRIGEVRNVTLEDQSGNVVVQLAVEPRFTVRRNEKPTLIVGLLGSDTSIDFIPIEPDPGQPPPDRAVVPPGAELPGVRAATVSTLLNRASEVVPTTQETMNDIRKSIQRLEKMAPLMEDALKESRDLVRNLRDSVPDARRMMDEVRQLSQAVRETVPDLRKTNDEARELFKATRESIPDLRKTSDEARELFKATRESIPDLRKTNDEIRELARAIRESVPDLRKTNDEIRELAKAAREAIPDVRKTLDDVGAAARYWARVGERLNNLLQVNEPKLTRMIDQINDLLNRGISMLSDENIRQFNQMLRDLRDATGNLPSISRNLDELLKDGRGSLKRLDSTLQRSEQFMNDLTAVTKPLGERGPSITRNLDESLDKLNRTLTDVREIVRSLGQADGTLNRLLTDPTLYNQISSAMCGVSKLIPRLERIVKDFETFADKLARHPELIGVGGAVRPSNGLKDPPPLQGTIIKPQGP